LTAKLDKFTWLTKKKMAKRKDFKMSVSQRQKRMFSESFKIEKVREIESGQTRPCEIMKQYEVSHSSVYKWIEKYGSNQDRSEKLVVESKSDTKELLELKKKLADLERIIGQKQILIDFKDKIIELAEKEYGIDIKKNFSTERSSITGKKEKQ
jgi:transposase